MPGRSNSCRRRTTGSVITPRSSATTGSGPSAAVSARNSSAPGPRRHRPPAAVVLPVGTAQYETKPAKVIDAHEVDQVEHPAQPLDPPAVAVCAHRPPVVQRVAPELARGRERVGRHSGDTARLKELRVRTVVGAVLGDIDRDVAEDPDAAVGRIRAERPPFALEADLVVEQPAVPEPAVDPVRVPLDERLGLVGLDGRLPVGEQGG